MRIARVRGTVTASRVLPSMVGARYRLAVPLMQEELSSDSSPESEWLVVFDELGAGHGSLIMVSEGAEAAQPFHPELKPIDAYNTGIVDRIDIKSE